MEYVQVPVPSPQVPTVYDLLASLSKGPGVTLVPSAGSYVVHNGIVLAITAETAPSVLGQLSLPTAKKSTLALTPEWTPELAARAYRESDKAMRKILTLLSATPDGPMTPKEVAQAAGVAVSKLPSILGAFGHRCKSRYKQNGSPILSYYDKGLGGRTYSLCFALATAVQAEAKKATP